MKNNRLTVVEKRILREMIKEESVATISKKLNLTKDNVAKEINIIMEKLNAKSKTNAIVKGLLLMIMEIICQTYPYITNMEIKDVLNCAKNL